MYDSQRTSGESLPPWYSLLPGSRAEPRASIFPSSAEEPPASRLPFGDRHSAVDAPYEGAVWPEGVVDVVVIGAGITGLSTAYHLLRSGYSVVVLDKGGVACGETSRSTAHVSSALDDHYSVLETMHGEDGARLAAQSHTAAIASIESIVRKEGIECSFERVR